MRNVAPGNPLKAVLLAGIVAGVAATALPAVAQPLPSYAGEPTDQTIHGTVASINGEYNISVRDDRGYLDNVTLHQGTIINPTGLRLAPGQRVTILGDANGGTFDANEINTPYRYVAAYPYGYGYPYAYGPYGYGYGPAFGLGFRYGPRFGPRFGVGAFW